MAQPSPALGVLGMTRFTAWWGLTAIRQPQVEETLLASTAAGAVAPVAGQAGRLPGCHVVGVAGGADKCRRIVEELGFDRSPLLAFAEDRITSRSISGPAASDCRISAGSVLLTVGSSCFHDHGPTNKAAVASIEARE